MQIPKQLQQQVAPHVPLISASLLNAVYARLLLTKPINATDDDFQEALKIVQQQWGQTMTGLYSALFGQEPPQ